jgi:hypothetical protein
MRLVPNLRTSRWTRMETSMSKKNESCWWKLSKHFQGGIYEVQVQMPKGFDAKRWQFALEWFGEHTIGGHAYGYRIYKSRLRTKSKKLVNLKMPIENF